MNAAAVGILILLLVVVGGVIIWLATRETKKEGDVCTGLDLNAAYKLDGDLECRFAQCRPGFAINAQGACVFIVEEEAKTAVQIATEELMYKLHDTIIWYRYNQQPANTTRQVTNQVEYVFMFRHTSAGVELDKKKAFETNPHIFKTKNVGNVWEIPFNSGKKSQKSFGRKETKCKYGHSGFPLELPETCIALSTKENDVVLDLFMGTGQTGIACKKLNRKFIGIEMNKEAFDLSKQRISDTLF